MLPISSELLVIEEELSIDDFIDILVENVNRCCLILDSKEQNISDIILPVDLNSILIEMKLKKPEYF